MTVPADALGTMASWRLSVGVVCLLETLPPVRLMGWHLGRAERDTLPSFESPASVAVNGLQLAAGRGALHGSSGVPA